MHLSANKFPRASSAIDVTPSPEGTTMERKQADILDKTEAFLAKRDGIDKVCIGYERWLLPAPKVMA